MNTFLAYTKEGRVTGARIAEAMDIPHGTYTPAKNPDLVIRWGSRKWLFSARVINWSAAIGRASDKLQALRVMEEAGIPVVEHTLSWTLAKDKAGDRLIFGRKRSGMQGRDIKVYDPARVYGGTYPVAPKDVHEWYSIYEQPTREMRLHVVGDEVIRVQGKYRDFPEDGEKLPLVRNYRAGYRYRTPSQEIHSSRKEWAVKAVKVLGLDFGAVDMLLFGADKECKILEVNTAPACSPLTVQRYAESLSALI